MKQCSFEIRRKRSYDLLALGIACTLIGCRDKLDDELGDRNKGQERSVRASKAYDDDELKAVGIETTALLSTTWKRTQRIFGRVVPNPSAIYDVQSAFAGEIVVAELGWPKFGQAVEAEQLLGYVAVRISPEIRLDLENRLAESQVKIPIEEEVVRVLGRTVEELRKVTQREILARSELDSAVINLEKSKLQLSVNLAIVKRLANALKEIDNIQPSERGLWKSPIVARYPGVVTEIQAHPGTQIEAGRTLLQILDFGKAMVRIDFPIARSSNSNFDSTLAESLDIQIAGKTHRATRVGLASLVDNAGQFNSTLFKLSLDTEANFVRPGMQAISEVPMDSEAIPAFSIPESSVVYHEGLPFVFAKTGEFIHRKFAKLLQRIDGRWIVERSAADKDWSNTLQENDEVVSKGAQTLLSLEFLKSGGDPD